MAGNERLVAAVAALAPLLFERAEDSWSDFHRAPRSSTLRRVELPADERLADGQLGVEKSHITPGEPEKLTAGTGLGRSPPEHEDGRQGDRPRAEMTSTTTRTPRDQRPRTLRTLAATGVTPCAEEARL
jgi:hypothetical protein